MVRPKPQSLVPEVPCNVSNQKPTSRQAAKAVEAARKASDGQPDAETKEVTIWGFLELLGLFCHRESRAWGPTELRSYINLHACMYDVSTYLYIYIYTHTYIFIFMQMGTCVCIAWRQACTVCACGQCSETCAYMYLQNVIRLREVAR